MMKLIERAARDYGADVSKGPIRADAFRLRCNTQPHFPSTLANAPGQRAIVDDLIADRLNPTRLLQSFTTDEHASAGRAGCFSPGVTNPLRRIQHKEEEHECRDEGFLGEC